MDMIARFFRSRCARLYRLFLGQIGNEPTGKSGPLEGVSCRGALCDSIYSSFVFFWSFVIET